MSSEIKDYKVESADGNNFSISLFFNDKSSAVIHYFVNGGMSFAKERIEVFCGNSILQMNNYRSLKGFNWKGFNSMFSWKQDKGQKACAKAFVKATKDGGEFPIPFEDIVLSSRISIELADSLKQI